LNQREQVTMVIATHDRSIAEKSSRIVRLRDGKVEAPAAS